MDTSQLTPKLFLLDCETTGLVATSDRILELAVQRYVPGQSLQCMQPLSILVNPDGVPCSASARSVHNISDEELIVADYFPAVWGRIIAYIAAWTDSRTEIPVIVAHNARFDAQFLRCELERARISVPDNLLLSCSLDLARNLWPGTSAALSRLAKKANVPSQVIKKAHRAAADVKLLAAVLNHMNDSIRDDTDAGDIESVLHAGSVPFAGNSMPSSAGISFAPKQHVDEGESVVHEINQEREIIHSIPKLPLRPADIKSPSLATKFFPLSGANAPAVRLVYAPVRESNADIPAILPDISGRLLTRAPPSSPPQEQVLYNTTNTNNNNMGGTGRGRRFTTSAAYGNTCLTPEDRKTLAKKLEALSTDSKRTSMIIKTPSDCIRKKKNNECEGSSSGWTKVAHTPCRKLDVDEGRNNNDDESDDWDNDDDELFHTPIGKPDTEGIKTTTPTTRKLPPKSPASASGWRRVSSTTNDSEAECDNDDDNNIHFTPTGACYHYTRNCKGLELAKSVKSSPRKSAPGKLRPCKVCSPRGKEKVISNANAEYFHTPNGAKYHTRSNCYGLREARNILGMSQIPKHLQACKVCVLKLNYQYVNI